jgi:hypothetical protein
MKGRHGDAAEDSGESLADGEPVLNAVSGHVETPIRAAPSLDAQPHLQWLSFYVGPVVDTFRWPVLWLVGLDDPAVGIGLWWEDGLSLVEVGRVPGGG